MEITQTASPTGPQAAKLLGDGVYAIHADIEDAAFFEGIWRIANGVTLNAYIVKNEKIALIDFVRDWENAPEKVAEQLASIGLDFKSIDYLVLNHLEPDHAGHIAALRQINPDIEIISTQKGIDLVRKFFKIDSNLRVVKTGDTLDLGGGTVLSFIEIPNVHWPETMVTYDAKTQTLFSCDAFGSYGKTGNRIFDDEFTAEEHEFFEKESLRYYANIVASFSVAVKAALVKLAGFSIKTVAPSHGLIWRTNPSVIIDRYAKYAGYNTGGELEKEICIIWGSMYGSTQKGAEAVAMGIAEAGVPYKMIEIPETDFSIVLADAYRAKGLVLAMPTYEYKMFPPMAQVLDLFIRKHIVDKTVFRLGSWGWVGGAKREYDETIMPLKWTSLEPYEWQGIPCDADLEILKQRGKELAQMIIGS